MNYKYHIFTIIISFITHASLAADKCHTFLEYVETNNKQELLRASNYCQYLITIGNYRTHFVKQYGNEAWDSLKWLKGNSNATSGSTLSDFDWDIDEIIKIANLLNSNTQILINNKEIEIDNRFSFNNHDNKWFFEIKFSGVENSPYDDIKSYIKAVQESRIMISNGATAEDVMTHFHDNVTSPIFDIIF